MSNDETQPVRPDGDATLPPAPAAAAAEPASPTATTADPVAATPAGRRSFGERYRSLRTTDDGSRTYGLAALIASALAGVIVGGLGLSAVQAIGDDGHGDRGGWAQRRDGSDDGGPGFDGRGGMHGGPPGMPGQVQPTTAPEDDSDG